MLITQIHSPSIKREKKEVERSKMALNPFKNVKSISELESMRTFDGVQFQNLQNQEII